MRWSAPTLRMQRRRTPVRVDELKQVDTVHAHSGGPTNSNAGNLNNAGQIQPQSNQIQPQTTSNIVVPSNLTGLGPTEFKRLSDVVTAKGLKLSSIKALYDDLGLKNVQEIVKQTDDEIAAAIRAIEIERIDGGHSIARHGPQIKDNVLEDRVTTGIAADGVFSPTQASTRFLNYETWEKTRGLALKEIEKFHSIDLSKPPSSNADFRQEIIVEFDKAIDDGFVGDIATKRKIPNPANPKRKGKVYSSTNSIQGVTRTKTVVAWDGTSWKVKQHIPWATDWNDATKTYSSSAQSLVKLP